MADNLEILIKSIYDATGVKVAEADLQKLVRQTRDLGPAASTASGQLGQMDKALTFRNEQRIQGTTTALFGLSNPLEQAARRMEYLSYISRVTGTSLNSLGGLLASGLGLGLVSMATWKLIQADIELIKQTRAIQAETKLAHEAMRAFADSGPLDVMEQRLNAITRALREIAKESKVEEEVAGEVKPQLTKLAAGEQKDKQLQNELADEFDKLSELEEKRKEFTDGKIRLEIETKPFDDAISATRQRIAEVREEQKRTRAENAALRKEIEETRDKAIREKLIGAEQKAIDLERSRGNIEQADLLQATLDMAKEKGILPTSPEYKRLQAEMEGRQKIIDKAQSDEEKSNRAFQQAIADDESVSLEKREAAILQLAEIDKKGKTAGEQSQIDLTSSQQIKALREQAAADAAKSAKEQADAQAKADAETLRSDIAKQQALIENTNNSVEVRKQAILDLAELEKQGKTEGERELIDVQAEKQTAALDAKQEKQETLDLPRSLEVQTDQLARIGLLVGGQSPLAGDNFAKRSADALERIQKEGVKVKNQNGDWVP